ncbi:MAG: NYN domain-containing protein, partial [archaeon]|nr:NYN domain-containing protein [archaeon]
MPPRVFEFFVPCGRLAMTSADQSELASHFLSSYDSSLTFLASTAPPPASPYDSFAGVGSFDLPPFHPRPQVHFSPQPILQPTLSAEDEFEAQMAEAIRLSQLEASALPPREPEQRAAMSHFVGHLAADDDAEHPFLRCSSDESREVILEVPPNHKIFSPAAKAAFRRFQRRHGVEMRFSSAPPFKYVGKNGGNSPTWMYAPPYLPAVAVCRHFLRTGRCETKGCALAHKKPPCPFFGHDKNPCRFGDKCELDHNAKLSVVISGESPLVTLAIHALRETLLSPREFLDEMGAAQEQIIHVFVDNSNILNGSKFKLSTGRLDVTRLVEVVEDDRRASKRLIGGSTPPDLKAYWDKWRSLGYTVRLSQRAPGVGEVFVDDMIIGELNSVLIDRNGSGDTIVLLTGDGNNNQDHTMLPHRVTEANNNTFPAAVLRALTCGFRIEVWSWEACVSKRYREIQQCYSDTGCFKLCYLDQYASYLSFKDQSSTASASASGSSKPPATSTGSKAIKKSFAPTPHLDPPPRSQQQRPKTRGKAKRPFNPSPANLDLPHTIILADD